MNLDVARRALLADAQEDADLLLARADRDSDERLARARQEGAALVAAARADGAREAAERLARHRAAARREARRLVLAARQAALRDLRERSRRAVRDLARDDDVYPDVVERLRVLAATRLGPQATVTVDPEGEPGLVARDGHRRVDLRLATLADRAVDALGAEVGSLWS